MTGDAHRTRAWDGAAIAIPSLLAGVLCLLSITGRSLGFDEAATVTIAAQHGSAIWSAIAHDGGNMSGYYLLLHVLIGWFGDGLLAIRLPSAAASVVTVGLIAAIGLRTCGRSAGVAAGVLGAVSLPLVFWAQNARGYALMIAFVCAAFVAFISLCESDSPRRRDWIAYVLFMALGTYSSFVAVLVVPAQLLVLAWRREMLVRFGLALIALAVCCVPLMALALSRGSGQLFWVPRPTTMVETQVLQSVTSAGLQPSFHATAITTPLLVLTLGLLGAAGANILRTAWRGGMGPGWPGVMVLAWILVPVVLTWLASFVIQPTFVPRNLLMSMPPVALALGIGLADRRLPRSLALGVLLGLVALRGVALASGYGISPEPWQQTVEHVLARARPRDCIAFYPSDGRMAFQYYVGTGSATGRAPRSVLPVARWGQVRPYVERYVILSPAQIARRTAGCRRLWFVTSHEGQPDGPAQSRENRVRFLRLRAELERAFSRAPTQSLGYAAAIHVELMPARAAGSSRRRSAR